MNVNKAAGWTAAVVVLLATHIVALMQGATMGYRLHSNEMETSCVQNQYVISMDNLIFACALVGIADQKSDKK